MSYCTVHGRFDDPYDEGCAQCREAEDDRAFEARYNAYKSSNPGEHQCPHCLYWTLRAGATRCPSCRGLVGSDYWTAEARRQEARKEAAEVADQEAAESKRAKLETERETFHEATKAIRRRLTAIALIIAGLWWALREYQVWLPDSHPKYVATILAVFSHYVGAIFGAAIVFIVFAWVTPRSSREGVVVFTLVFLFALELAQLYPAPLINDLRATWLGLIVWDNGFRWSRLFCYIIGVVPMREQSELSSFGMLVLTLLIIAVPVAFWQFVTT